MITFTFPLVLLVGIPLSIAVILIWRYGYVNVSPRRSRLALAVRLLLTWAVILGLAGAAVDLPQNDQAVVFVADLSASDSSARSTIQQMINGAVARRPSGDRAGVVSVGQHALVEQPVSPLSQFDAFQSPINLDYTNLEGGLELANAILPNGYQRRVVVASDGQQNIGNALAAARVLRAEGVRVDVVPVRTRSGPEVRIDQVAVPSQLQPHEHFALTVTLHANVDTSGTLDIYRDHTLVLSRHIQVPRGTNQLSFAQHPLSPGSHTYQVHIDPAADTQPENNVGSAFTIVRGPPRVLVIAATRTEAANVLASLHTGGIRASFQTPPQVVPTLANLQRYAGIVIVDTPADVLGSAFLAQLVPYVRDLGHGLVVIGGQEAYGMGGYGQTPLEQALPVNMDLPRRKDLPSAAVVLIIESLEAQMPVNISKEAGKGVVNLLTPRDLVAVNDAPFDGSAGWAVKLQHVTNKHAIDHAIDTMNPGDPMSYVPYLQSAYKILKHAKARVKHIILLGDGDAEDPTYQKVVKRIRAGGVTVSTVATNGMGMADFQTMQNIAHWGGGRYYRADDPSRIPKIFLREARTVARSGIIEGKFYPQELSANPMLRDLHSVPPLHGYVATTPKPTGELVLVSPKLDPVLAGWQFGLGRAVAWTSDAAGLWTRDWLAAPETKHFWADLVAWTLPAVSNGHLFVATSSGQGQGHVSVDIPPTLGANPVVTAHILDPSLHGSTIQLQPSAPGHFSGSFLAHAEGPYFITAEARGSGHAEAGQAGLTVPYSAEYRASGTNLPFLRSLAAAGGGSLLSGPRGVWLNNLTGVYAQHVLTTWLWLLALLLLPIDIGIRRLIISRRDVATVWAALPFARAAPGADQPAVTPLGMLRTRRTAEREHAREAPIPKPRPLSPQPPSPDMPRPARSASVGPQAPSGGSTTGRLLAAKRRRR